MSFLYRFFKNIFNRNNRIHLNLDNDNNIIRQRVLPRRIVVAPRNPIINNYIEPITCHTCRYWYMNNFQNSMIAPCKCSGSVKYVHIYCLERWRRIKNDPSKCEICNKKYKIPRNNRVVKTYRRFLNRQERERRRNTQNRNSRNRNIRNRTILRTIYRQ